jgi:hypothetical protein
MFSPEFLAMVASYTLPVLAIVELVKRLLKSKGWVVVVISVAASAVACVPVIGAHGVVFYAVLAGCVTLSANGVFKAVNMSGTRQ